MKEGFVSRHVALAMYSMGLLALSVMPLEAAADACPSLLEHKLQRLADAQTLRLCDAYRGKVLLVVNTASKCGFTDQYAGLEALYEELGPKGLVVLGFPSNDFGQQEPGSEAQIAEFCRSEYGVQFPMFAKGPVSGKAAQPLYKDLARIAGEAPRWNFHKYLIDRSGKRVLSFPSQVAPDAPLLRSAIEKMLAENP